jgi:hypothetical protein
MFLTAIVLLSGAHAASAAVLPQLLEDRGLVESLARELAPDVRVGAPGIERELSNAASQAEREAVNARVQALGSITDDEVQAVRDSLEAGDASTEQPVRACVAEGLRGVANDYRKAVSDVGATGQAPIWPLFETDFSAAISGCLTSAVQGAPPELVQATSDYFAKQAAPFVQRALNADSFVEVLEGFLETIADQVESTNQPVNAGDPGSGGGGPADAGSGGGGSTTSGDSGGGGLSWGVVVLVILALVGIGWLLAASLSRHRPD